MNLRTGDQDHHFRSLSTDQSATQMRNRAAIAESRRRDAGREHQEQPQVKPGTKGGRLAPANDSLKASSRVERDDYSRGFDNQELITLPSSAGSGARTRKEKMRSCWWGSFADGLKKCDSEMGRCYLP